ncbi:MAG: GAF domain-containing protein [Planctomycetes bacterium]|nr:GAF domain-containing protein [Planctomycetota bacterium]
MAPRNGKRDGAPPASELRAQLAESDAACRRLLRELEIKSESLAIVHGILGAIASNASLETLLQVFAANLKTLCPYDRLSIALVESDGDRFRIPFLVRRGRVVVNDENPSLIEDDHIAQVVRSNAPLLRTRIPPQQVRFKSDTKFAKTSYGCELILPLRANGRTIGTFNVGCFDAEVLTQQHERALGEIASCIAIALSQYRERKKSP